MSVRVDRLIGWPVLHCIPVDYAPVVESFHSLSHAEEAVLDIVPPILPPPTIRQPILQSTRQLSHSDQISTLHGSRFVAMPS